MSTPERAIADAAETPCGQTDKENLEGRSAWRPTTVTGLSHVAIGVRDMAASIAFYRDVIGLHVVLDAEEQGQGKQPFHRRAVYLRWRDGPAQSFIVLDHHLDRACFGAPAQLFQVGLHHFSFWVDDCDTIIERARREGATVESEPHPVPGRPYGYADADETTAMVRTCFVRDPDGNLVQLDQWVGQDPDVRPRAADPPRPAARY